MSEGMITTAYIAASICVICTLEATNIPITAPVTMQTANTP